MNTEWNQKGLVIFSPDDTRIEKEPCFWNNYSGWTCLDLATRFTCSERKRLNLPIGGKWMSLKDAHQVCLRSTHNTRNAYTHKA